MFKWSNGLKGFSVIEKHSMMVYDFYFYEGMLEKLHCHSYYGRETKFEDVYNPLESQVISKEHFEEAFEIFCYDNDCDEIIRFFECLADDNELKKIAKEIIRKCSYRVAKKAHALTEAIWELEREK